MTAIHFIEHVIQVAAKFGSSDKQQISQLNLMFEKLDDNESSEIIMKLFMIDNYDIQSIAGGLFSANLNRIKFNIDLYLEKGIENYNKSIYSLPECLAKLYPKELILHKLINAKSESVRRDAQEKIDTLIWWMEKK